MSGVLNITVYKHVIGNITQTIDMYPIILQYANVNSEILPNLQYEALIFTIYKQGDQSITLITYMEYINLQILKNSSV